MEDLFDDLFDDLVENLSADLEVEETVTAEQIEQIEDNKERKRKIMQRTLWHSTRWLIVKVAWVGTWLRKELISKSLQTG